MSTSAGEVNQYPTRSGHRDRVELEHVIPIGAAGAVAASSGAILASQDDPNMSAVHGAAGVYALTFPPAADGGGQLDGTIVSPAGTVRGFFTTAFLPNSGTASITCVNAAGAATDPANGDVIRVQYFLNGRAP